MPFGRLFIGNAFSLGMLTDLFNGCGLSEGHSLDVRNISPAGIKKLMSMLDWVSIVGHKETAMLFSSILDVEIPMNRVTTTLEIGDILVVGQYTGPRLEEGATSLPDGAKITWLTVKVGEKILND